MITLNPEGYPEEKIEDTKRLVEILKNCGVRIKLQEHMHEHFAIIDSMVWKYEFSITSESG